MDVVKPLSSTPSTRVVPHKLYDVSDMKKFHRKSSSENKTFHFGQSKSPHEQPKHKLIRQKKTTNFWDFVTFLYKSTQKKKLSRHNK
jgi:hypothetical protein